MAPSTHIQNLPPEILDFIFDYLEPRFLDACSLTSRSWRHLAHHRLFSKVSIGRYSINRTIRGFQELLDADPILGSWVVCLTLSCKTLTSDDVRWLVWRLPKLETLDLEDFFLINKHAKESSSPFLPNRLSPPWAQQPPSRLELRTLMVSDSSIATAGAQSPWLPLFQIINIFDSIDTLFLVSSREPENQSQDIPAVPARKTLVKRMYFLPRLESNSTTGTATQLTLDYVYMEHVEWLKLSLWGEMDTYQPLLNSAIGLKTLSVEVRHSGSQTNRSLSLINCPHLETLTFCVRSFDSTFKDQVKQLRENMNLFLRMLHTLWLSRPTTNHPDRYYENRLTQIDFLVMLEYSLLSDLCPGEGDSTLVDSVSWVIFAQALEPFSRSQLKTVNIKMGDNIPTSFGGVSFLGESKETIERGLKSLMGRCTVDVTLKVGSGILFFYDW